MGYIVIKGWTCSATILRQTVVFKQCSIGSKGSKLCQENIPYIQGRSWGLQGPSAGCTSGPCLKLFNLYVRSIYLFVLFTQCLCFFKFVGVQVQKPNNQM